MARTAGRLLTGLALCASLASVGCMDFEGLEGERPVRTHVQDWRNEVIYQLMVDRFANGDLANDYRVDRSAPARYHGGDWRGVEGKLDYLEQLGVTTLWISPLVKNVETDAGVDGYHGYWTQDFTQLNPHFGDLASLRRLVDAAHERGIKIILDIVVNHVGQLFYYDINLNGQPDERVAGTGPLIAPTQPDGSPTSPVSHVNEYDPDFDPRGVQAWTSLGEAGPAPIIFPYDAASNHVPPAPDIFLEPRAYNRRGRVWSWDDAEQVELGDFPGGLKDINTQDPEVRAALVDIFAHWVEVADFDGFRIDTLKHVEHGFWQTFAPAVRQRLASQGKQNFFMFGEAFDGRDDLVGSYTFDQEVDSVFYFPQHFTIFRDVFQAGQDTKRIETLFSQRLSPGGNYGTTPHDGGIGVPPNKALVNFIDNHDVPRFLYLRPDPAALDNALLFLFTEDGIPCIYYGTEQGFSGGNDPANREDLWLSGYDRNHRQYQWISKLAKIRKAYPALTHGDLKIVWASDRTGTESDVGIIAFERAGGDAGDAYALVVINTNAKQASSPEFNGDPMKTTLPSGTELVDVLAPSDPPIVVGQDGAVSVTVPPTSGKILVRRGDLVNL
ncbi:MAG: alpha-amylase family glycosyl hydrolase [Polyangiaceae bacterium]